MVSMRSISEPIEIAINEKCYRSCVIASCKSDKHAAQSFFFTQRHSIDARIGVLAVRKQSQSEMTQF